MIETYGKYGDPRMMAERANQAARAQLPNKPPSGGLDVPFHDGPPKYSGAYGPQWMHGRSPQEVAQLKDRFESFLPRVATKFGAGGRASDFFSQILPPGANLAPNAGSGYRQAQQNHYDLRKRGTGSAQNLGGQVFNQTQQSYQPEFASPDRQNYPQHRNLANIYWRMFYKLDHVVGTGVDLISELPWGECEIVGEGVDGEIKDAAELMWQRCNVPALLPYFVREHTVLGEVGIQTILDPNDNLWGYIGVHNPDNLEVIYSPYIKMDPIVRFKPDDRLQQVLNSTSPMLQHVRESIPPELLAALSTGQPVELHPLNFTFIARKQHPYDVRGTSLLSRMWRIFMFEDAIYNASIAIARRAAAPLKVAKLGDRQTGWIPGPDQHQMLMELLAQCELDPNAWLLWHYGIEFDMVGSQERTWKIDQSAEYIERVKLIALGISKAFLWGEVTYASATSGLTVFLQRLKGLRELFTSAWIQPKFFKPISVINSWVKPTQAELSHNVRTRRSYNEILEDGRYIVPECQWARQLDPSVEASQIQAVQALSGLGVAFSDQYMASLLGKDWEEQLRQKAREFKIKQQVLKETPGLQIGPPPDPGAGGGGGGAPQPMPGIPPEELGFEPPPPPEASVQGDVGNQGGPSGRVWKRPDLWTRGRHGAWQQGVVSDLIGVLGGDIADEEIWSDLVSKHPEIRGAGSDGWDTVEDWLISSGYPAQEISALREILASEGLAGSKFAFSLESELNELDQDDAYLLSGKFKRPTSVPM